jgi:UDP-2,4-diacetamido-2,4,6-trideoxy-beta-L-altropyranose hydrolase
MGRKYAPPKLLIRADADALRGSGHVMRCIALVEAWRATGGEAVFLTRCKNERLLEWIHIAGAEVVMLRAGSDLEATASCCRDVNPSFVVLDGYDFDFQYCRSLRARWQVMLIEDSIRFARYEIDILLNQNLGAERLIYNVNPEADLLLGTGYALLRQEFTVERERRQRRSGSAHNILVTLGGSDSENVTLKVIQAVLRMKSQAHVRVIAGPDNRNLRELSAAADVAVGHIEVLTAAPEMGRLMAWADIAVSAGGSTCWELACLGLPAVILVTAANQKAIARNLGAAGAVMNLGWHQAVSCDRIATVLDGLFRSPVRRSLMSQKGKALVDGKGAGRVADALWRRAKGGLTTRNL